MNPKTIPLEYSNSLVFELEKAFYDERGKGARFRMTTVGREYFRHQCLPRLASSDIGQIAQTIGGVLERDGVTGQVATTDEGRLLRVRVEGCVHRAVEEKMIAHGVEPFTCVPANLLALAIEEKLDRPVELAEIKLEDGACVLLLVLFDKRPTLE
jgi:hypothetical protein